MMLMHQLGGEDGCDQALSDQASGPSDGNSGHTSSPTAANNPSTPTAVTLPLPPNDSSSGSKSSQGAAAAMSSPGLPDLSKSRILGRSDSNSRPLLSADRESQNEGGSISFLPQDGMYKTLGAQLDSSRASIVTIRAGQRPISFEVLADTYTYTDTDIDRCIVDIDRYIG
jgi:hypothetical protein